MPFQIVNAMVRDSNFFFHNRYALRKVVVRPHLARQLLDLGVRYSLRNLQLVGDLVAQAFCC